MIIYFDISIKPGISALKCHIIHLSMIYGGRDIALDVLRRIPYVHNGNETDFRLSTHGKGSSTTTQSLPGAGKQRCRHRYRRGEQCKKLANDS